MDLAPYFEIISWLVRNNNKLHFILTDVQLGLYLSPAIEFIWYLAFHIIEKEIPKNL